MSLRCSRGKCYYILAPRSVQSSARFYWLLYSSGYHCETALNSRWIATREESEYNNFLFSASSLCPQSTRPSQGFWGAGEKVFISGEQGNKGKIFRGTGEQRQYWGTGNIRKHIFDFWEQVNKPIYFRGTREHVTPQGGPHKLYKCRLLITFENSSDQTKCSGDNVCMCSVVSGGLIILVVLFKLNLNV